jgi:hypothetical protein
MANIVNIYAEALKTVLSAIGGAAPAFREVWSYDRGRVDALPGVTMGYGGSKKDDSLGIRTIAHRRKWLHKFTLRLWLRYDPANSVVNETEIRTLIARVVDAIETDPTLGDLVDGAGVMDVGEFSQFQNAQGRAVGYGVDILVGIVGEVAVWYS